MEIYTSATEIQIVKKITTWGYTHTPIEHLFPIPKKRKITLKEVGMLASNGWDRERMRTLFIIPEEQPAPPKRTKTAIQDGMRGLRATCKECRDCYDMDYNLGGAMCPVHDDEQRVLDHEMSTLEA
jgi:hypothetical protein